MSLAPGARLGPYEIITAIGAGGMGEVYRARDAKLNRDVAIKILPALFAADVERIARFQREAQVLASLNHPNIAHIYGFEDAQGIHALVLELVEGPTLADRVAQGPIAVDEALPIATQIAEALEAAHELGIVHRDLKPANIKLTGDGVVKVLDFGLARAFSNESPDSSTSMSPTITSPAMTARGVILGTAAYMSPEQAKGKLVDKRTDIWAFGCVLYEMLTGKRAFGGDDVTDTLAEIIKGEPDWNALPKDTPAAVAAVLRRCLEKDRKKRIADVADVKYEIEHALDVRPPTVMSSAATPRLRRGRRVASALMGALAGAAFAAWALTRFATPFAGPAAVRFSFPLPEGWSLWTPNTSLGQSALAVSPDGARVAFVARQPGGKSLLWVRALDTLDAVPLPGTENATSPFWSPEGRSLGFFAGGKLRRIDLSGGNPITLADAPDERGGTWNQDGVIVFAPALGVGLQKISASGGTPSPATTLVQGDPGHAKPYFLPDGRHFLYRLTGGAGETRSIYLATLENAERVVLMDKVETGEFFYSQGHLLFLRGSTLMASAIDSRSWTLTGDAFPIADGVSNFGNANFFAASPNGVLAFQPGIISIGAELVWVDRTGKRLDALGATERYDDLELSPDGKRLAVTIADRSTNSTDVWVFDVVRGVGNKLTTDPGNEYSPVWSADGDRIVFDSPRQGVGGVGALFEKKLAGVDPAVPIGPQDLGLRSFSRARDGTLLYQSTGTGRAADIWVWPASGSRQPVLFLGTRFNEFRAKFWPDERWVSYTSNRLGTDEVHVTSFPKPGEEIRVSTAGGTFSRWRRDGREIFYVAPDRRLMAVEVDGRGAEFKIGVARPLFELSTVGGTARYQYDAAANGQRFIVNVSPQASMAQPLTVVVNWMAGLKK